MTARFIAAASFALTAFCLPAFAQSRIVPAQPIAFEPVNLRMTVDSCMFAPATVQVRAVGSTLKVTQQPNACFAAGTPEVVDVRLGSLATGDYRVEVYNGSGDGAATETLALQVLGRVGIAVFPPPVRPLTDYTGMWWTPTESGWGLSLHQSPADVLFGAWFVYGASGQPEWYSLQGGQWTSATRWTGTIYRTTGPYFGTLTYDPRLVVVTPVGTATLDFTQVPGDEGHARFSYSIGNFAIAKVISRAPQ